MNGTSSPLSRLLLSGALLAGLLGSGPLVPCVARAGSDWPQYGGDAGGSRYATLSQISPANVNELEKVWVWHHGDVVRRNEAAGARSTTAFELTPILVAGTLYGCTPFNRVFALDPATGVPRWTFDPKLDRTQDYANQMICRGVASWRDAGAKEGAACRRRIFSATVDGRLLALDAATGKLCRDFGEGGQVDLKRGIGKELWVGEYSVTSAPTVVHDLVVVGGAIGDNQRVGAPSGVVRAFDVRSGALRWAYDPVPKGQGGLRAAGSGWHLSSPNVWAPMSADEARDLLFLPTGGPSPDYASAWRHGLDDLGSSLVVLRASTGQYLWHYQTVHHDVWDFDVPAQPTLFSLRRGGREIPAVVQATKMGFLFAFQRETGKPLFPIEERPVPQGAEKGFVLSPTQPVPTGLAHLVRTRLDPEKDAWGVTPWDRGKCREQMQALRWDGMFTPPSTQGSIMYPGNAGGVNWGGVAVDPERQLLIANTSDFPWVVTLLDPARFAAERAAHPGVEISPQRGTPWAMRREMLSSPLGVPCNPPPWGTLAAVDLSTGKLRWQVPLGTIRDIAPIPLPIKLGTPSLGGPLVTASGLVFIGAAADNYLRAFDERSGEELWKARLPAGGQATPMTYAVGGRQFVVIAAGGYGRGPQTLGDALVAYALPE